MDTSKMDSDDDVIFVETEPVEIEVINLSDDETNTSSTSISTFSIPSRPANYIKKEINSAVISTPTPLQYISPLQLFSQNPFGSGFGVLQKVNINSRKSRKRNRRDKRIGKLVPKSETYNNSQKKSENKNKASSNQPQVNNIQIEKQTAHIPPSSDLSRSNNLNVEPEDNLQENSIDQSVDMVNQSQATRSGIEKTGSSCNLNVEPPTTIKYNNDLQDDLINQSVVNKSRAGLSSDMEKAGSFCNSNVESPIIMEYNNLQDDLGNQSVENEPQAGLGSDMEKTRSLCELSVESTATVEDNNLQGDSRSQNVVMMNEPQAGPTYTSVELPAEPENNDQEMNRDENPLSQQSAKYNTFQVQQGSHSMQYHRDKNRPAQQPATSNTFQVQQDSHSTTHQLFKNPKFSTGEYCDPLLSVIVEENYPDVEDLTEYHLFILRRLVGYEIDKVLATGTFIPRFRDSYVKMGVILVKSADAESQKWLQSIVPMLNPDPGVKLTIVSPRKLNQTYKVKICVYHDTSTQQEILTRMQRQNPDINMGSWQLQSIHRLNGAKCGSVLHMSIPAYSAKLLQSRQFKFHYGLYQIDVTMKDNAFYQKKC